MNVAIIVPLDGSTIESGAPITLTATVSDSIYATEDLATMWASSKDGDLGEGVFDASGKLSLTVSTLTAGVHVITLTVTNPAGEKEAASINIGVCTWAAPESFGTDIESTNWKIYGDAYWDPNGWLEMTGLNMGMKGAIYNTVDVVSPGDVSISFRIRTGGGGCGQFSSPGGADGFALNVIEAPTLMDLEALITEASTGGGLGYGVSGPMGDSTYKSFHVEFDTYYNNVNPDGNAFTDPTSQTHVGVMLDGDPSQHHLWAAMPNIEDEQWHDVTVEVDGCMVKVTVDAEEKINGDICAASGQDFKFRGGFIGMSGTTGWCWNWHSFDELEILQECLVQ